MSFWGFTVDVFWWFFRKNSEKAYRSHCESGVNFQIFANFLANLKFVPARPTIFAVFVGGLGFLGIFCDF